MRKDSVEQCQAVNGTLITYIELNCTQLGCVEHHRHVSTRGGQFAFVKSSLVSPEGALWRYVCAFCTSLPFEKQKKQKTKRVQYGIVCKDTFMVSCASRARFITQSLYRVS